ncbi:MAG: PH domain-containing protein [Candidatus Aenigmarchaeota archaeon]|nr:PH domain-containing protein [Candidatus Aenigmarchaeota archaeon]
MVDKYLNSGERVIFVTKNEVRVGEDKGFQAFVTNQRLIFLNRRGFVFKKDKMKDALLKNVNGVNLEEKGFLRKRKEMEIRSHGENFRLFGDHSDLTGLHRVINERLAAIV